MVRQDVRDLGFNELQQHQQLDAAAAAVGAHAAMEARREAAKGQ